MPGMSCFQKTEGHSECHASCPASDDWDCSVCSKTIGEDCSDSDDCCQEGHCFQEDKDHMRCLHACPEVGEGERVWDCEKCDIEEGGECTPGLTSGCCKVGECLRRDEFYSECLRHCPSDWDCQCTLSAGEECSAAATPACCDPTQGLSCFHQNEDHAECRESCPWGQDPAWDCECAIAEGGECTDPAAGCCHPGLECFYANASFAACLAECPAESGWSCAECSLRQGAECTDAAGGCCQSGECVQQSQHYAECRLECPVGEGWDCEHKCGGKAGDSCGEPGECCDEALGLACFKQGPGQWQCRESCPEGEGWACDECALEVHEECSEEGTAAPACCRAGECWQKDRWESRCEVSCPEGQGWECEVCAIEAGGECTNPESGCCAEGTTCFRKNAFYSQCRADCPLGDGWDCEECVLPEGADCHDPSAGCCESGTQCQQKDAEHSQCLRACPQGADWDCEAGCAIQEFGECTDSPECCRRGTSCFKKDDTFSQCLQECPRQQGWECDCFLLGFDDCTRGGCCASGSVCLQVDQTLSVCLVLLTEVVDEVVETVEDVEVVGINAGGLLGGLITTVSEVPYELVESELLEPVVGDLLGPECPDGWECPSICSRADGETCTTPEDGCCIPGLRCFRAHRWHAECLLACPSGWECDVPPAPCSDASLDQAGRCWQYMGQAESWAGANASCASAGLELASLHSAEERGFVVDLLRTHKHQPQTNVWVGAQVGAVEAWAWAWADGSPMQYMPWLGYMPGKARAGCASMVLTSRSAYASDAVDCDTPLPLLCASAPRPCPDGTYGPGGLECVTCPGNGSSVAGQNLGVMSCQCPNGTALTHNSEYAVHQTRECVALEGGFCSGGVYDASDGRCWARVLEAMDWAEAEAACEARGLHLASLAADSDKELLETLLVQHGLYSGRMMWVGATMQPAPDTAPTLWHWSDGAPASYLPWDLGVGEPSSRHGYAQFCAAARLRRSAGVSSLSLADQFCAEEHPAVCASAPHPCPSGSYGPKSPDCTACPMDGTSTEGANTDVLACRCPAGFAMLVGGGEPECVEAEDKCSGGVKDATTERCWKFVANLSVANQTFEDAERACEAEGLVLASLSPADTATWSQVLRAQARAGTTLDAQLAWVGGKATGSFLVGARVWEWVDGSTWGAVPWDETRREPREVGGQACLALRWDLAVSRAYGLAVECSQPLPALCAEPPVACEAGEHGPSKGYCAACPHGGASVKGSNRDVLACECPPGQAMVYGGAGAGECRDSDAMGAECNGGVWDAGMRRCWRLLPAPATPGGFVTWAGAQQECARWGLTLASLQAFSHTRLAANLFLAHALPPHALVWAGATEVLRGQAGEWEWADGSPAVAMPWLSGQPDKAGYKEHCTAVRWDGMLLDVACEQRAPPRQAGAHALQPEAGAVLGALCATPASEAWKECSRPGAECRPPDPCPDDYYGNGFECERCPAGATSSAASGSSAGVLGCKCGEGMALAHNWWVDGEQRLECVNASGCDGGVLDAGSGRCWRLLENEPRGDWNRKRVYCQRWGGELADVAGEQGAAMLKLLLDSAGFNASEDRRVFVRAHPELPEPSAPTVQPGTQSCPVVQWGAGGLRLRSDVRCNASLEVQLFACEAQTAALEAEEAVVVHSACAGCQFVRVGSNRSLARAGHCSLACSTLSLGARELQNIDLLAFRAMPGVRFLDLSHNQLPALELPTFAGLSTLVSLDLSHNSLARVQAGSLKGLSSLASLSLASNALAHVPPGLLDEMQGMHALFLAGNPLGCQPVFRFAVHVMDQSWAALPPCLPEGCSAEKPAFGRHALLERAPLYADLFSMLTVLSLARGDAAAALDQANLAGQLYVKGDDGKRYWCVATLESFDPAAIFRLQPAGEATAAAAWKAQADQLAESSAAKAVSVEEPTPSGDSAVEQGLGVGGLGEGSSSAERSSHSESHHLTWAGAALVVAALLAVLTATFMLVRTAGARWRRRRQRLAGEERRRGLAVDANMHTAMATLGKVFGRDTWERERIYSLPSSPTRSSMLSSPMRGSMPGSPTRSHEPLIRGIAGLLEVSKPPPLETCQWEMDPWISAPGHRDGRQRVYSMPSSPTSMPSSPTPSREGRGREQLKLQSDTSLVGVI